MASKKLPKVYQLGDTVAVQRTRRSDKSGLGEMGHGWSWADADAETVGDIPNSRWC